MNDLLAVIARDPVPPAYLATTDQVQAHRKAEEHLVALASTPKVHLLNDPNVYERCTDTEVSEKQVPFVKDMVCKAVAQEEARYYGFVNADIILAPHFATALAHCNTTHAEIIMIHRTDVDNLLDVEEVIRSENPWDFEIGKKVNYLNSMDGILMTIDVIHTFLKTFPDFVIAEPWWDTAAIYWARQSGFRFVHLNENQALHVKHPQQWSFRNPGARRARNLYMELLETWPLE